MRRGRGSCFMNWPSGLQANPEFTEAVIEADLRKLAEERGVKAGVLINASRAALDRPTRGSQRVRCVCLHWPRASDHTAPKA